MSSTWTPKHKHVSQLHSDGGGWADCFQASLARYLFEDGKVAIDRDPWDLIDEVSRVSRGAGDRPTNAYTDLAEAANALAHYSLPAEWTSSYQAALHSPWAILLVNGITLRPAQYPASFFGGEDYPDHFILWLPQWGGASNWFNDPLAYANGQADCQYDLDSVAGAFGGAYLLPSTGRGETGPIAVTTIAGCGLKTQPNHTCIAIATIPPKEEIDDLGTRITSGPKKEVWARVEFREKIGFVLASNLKAA